MNVMKISIPLSESEFSVLTNIASKECRQPKDQARFLILTGLGLTWCNNLNKHESAEEVLEDIGASVESVR